MELENLKTTFKENFAKMADPKIAAAVGGATGLGTLLLSQDFFVAVVLGGLVGSAGYFLNKKGNDNSPNP